MRPLQILCAAVHVAVLGVTAFFLLAGALAPLENAKEALVAARGWFFFAGLLLVALALVFAGAASSGKVRLMTGAWLLDSVVITALLLYVVSVDFFSESLSVNLIVGALINLIVGALAILATGS